MRFSVTVLHCGRRRSQHADVHHLAAAAASHAADRGGIEVIPADGEAAMCRPGGLLTGDVDPVPTLCIRQPYFRPSVARSLSGVAGQR